MLKFLVSILFIFYFINIFAQENVLIKETEFKTEDAGGLKKAMKSIAKGNELYLLKNPGSFLMALDYYLEAYQYNRDNPELNYKIGVCYLGALNKSKSLSYIQKAYDLNGQVAGDIHLQLAKALHYNYKFEDAINEYNAYKQLAKPDQLRVQQKLIDRKIQECKNGIELISKPEFLTFDNLKKINSVYPDYCPLITADESTMYYTSRRKNSTGGKRSEYDNQYFEDIFVSYHIDGAWSSPENVGSPLNTNDHDATVGLSPDGQQLFIYRKGDIFISKLDGDHWSNPLPLPGTINTPEIENSACFSYDMNSIYFTKGKNIDPAKSNSDIYVSNKMKNGQWGPAQKLSNVVNTPYDEDGVFMHPDGKTLYFSSKGHNSMGGFDIFKTVRQKDASWSLPENLGYPLNTPDEDIYFVISASGLHGYYSTVRDDGTGFSDIYKITFPENKLKANTDTFKTKTDTSRVTYDNTNIAQLTIVKGQVLDAGSNKPIEAQIEIVDNEKNEVVLTTYSNKKTGNYLFSLPSGRNYGLAIKADGYLFHSENFDLQEGASYHEVAKNVQMVDLEVDSKIILKNIFFKSAQSALNPESKTELGRLIQLMKQHPTLKVEISGHTDNVGDFTQNQMLSQSRAKEVVDYLIKNKINPNRMTFKGFGDTNPIANNDTEEGKSLNRRVEFRIISK